MAPSHSYAIFSARYAPLTGGIESFSQRLAHQLAAQGDRVVIVTSRLGDAPAHEIQDDGVEVYRLPARAPLGQRMPFARKNREYGRMMGELERKGFDRVLVNARFYQHSLEGVRFAKRIGAPVIVLDHGSAHLTMGNGLLDRVIERYEHGVTERMVALGPAFAGISQASRSWLEHFGIRTDAVICNSIDVDEFLAIASDDDFRALAGVDDHGVLVAFVGRLEPEKGALEFAQAAGLLDESFAFVMAGDGSLRAKLASMDDSRLRLLGRVDQATLSALLRDADVFCLPTRSEGFCTSLLEASAQGAIPVMPRVGGTDEVMGNEPTRFGVQLASRDPDAVAEGIRRASTLCAEQSASLSESVRETRTWQRSCDDLDRAFDRLASAQDPLA